jgi:hypothetical protein
MAENILYFSMNRCTSVEQSDECTLVSTCRLQDTLTTASVALTVKLPDLNIQAAEGRYRHAVSGGIPDIAERLKKLEGVRVGAGMLKIIKGLIGETSDLSQLVYMVEEACHGVILTLTKKILVHAPDDEAGKLDFYANMVKDNIRLYNRCAAFAEGTRLVAGLEPPA